MLTQSQLCLQESYRVTHNRDIVPSVPLQIMGFHHVAREVGCWWISSFAATAMCRYISWFVIDRD